MNLELTGKTALVLGAGGGLGGAIAQALAREGAQIAAADRDFEAAQRANAVTFVASGPAAYITGSTIRIDGGLIASI